MVTLLRTVWDSYKSELWLPSPQRGRGAEGWGDASLTVNSRTRLGCGPKKACVNSSVCSPPHP